MEAHEQFLLDLKSLLADLVNNHIGLLRGLDDRAGRVLISSFNDDDDSYTGQEPLSVFLNNQIECLQRKKARMDADIVNHLGGEERYRELWLEDFKKDVGQP